MKRSFLLAAALLLTTIGFSQDFPRLADKQLKSDLDFQDNQDLALECANYVLTGATSENEMNKQFALQFLLRWMEGTPNYTFSLGSEFMELTGSKEGLTGVYLAALVKGALTDPTAKLDGKEINKRALEHFLDYCAVPEHKVKKNKAIKKKLKERKKS